MKWKNGNEKYFKVTKKFKLYLTSFQLWICFGKMPQLQMIFNVFGRIEEFFPKINTDYLFSTGE